ncbi:glycosyltransferase family 2 protein [Rhizobium sp. LjRoot254]|uniref:glycosyltransferase family 2 protein n=1 Tax=Rhizobium sp. LjRoot254 TaxID=3342297 RepID=UPI003ECF5E77
MTSTTIAEQPDFAPLVSVVVPCYNRIVKLRRAIESVLHQTETNVEVIVVDDGSTEDVQGALAAIQDSRLRFVRFEENGGAAKARNRGMAEARGRFLALLDSDDWWLPKKLEMQLKMVADRPTSDTNWLVYNKIVIRTLWGDFPNPLRGFDPDRDDLAYYFVVERNYMQTSGLLAPLALFKKYPFDEHLKRHQDFDLLLRMRADNVRLLYCADENVIYDDTEYEGRISKAYKPRPTLDWMKKASKSMSRHVRSELYVYYLGVKMFRHGQYSGALYIAIGVLLYPPMFIELCSKISSKLRS